MHCNEEQPLLAATRESPGTAMKNKVLGRQTATFGGCKPKGKGRKGGNEGGREEGAANLTNPAKTRGSKHHPSPRVLTD